MCELMNSRKVKHIFNNCRFSFFSKKLDSFAQFAQYL